MGGRYRKAVWLIGAAALMVVSGCGTTLSQQEQLVAACGGWGALAGATAGGLAGGLTDASDYLWWTLPAGVVGGALIGAAVCELTSKPSVLPVAAPPRPMPPPPPPPAPAAPTHRIVLHGVHFDFDRADIRPADVAMLDEAAAELRAHPNVTIYVDGYCDVIGSMAYNQRLSERRANAVVNYLENHGISSSRLIPRGFGKTHFVATNSTAEGRAQNRRVELVPVR